MIRLDTMTDGKYSALVIGAGNIGAFFDAPGNINVLTHAHAFREYDAFHLLGFIDTDVNKAKAAASIWGGHVFRSLEEAFGETAVDVLSIAVPDEQHYDVLTKASQFPVKCVFAEKPLTTTYEEAETITRIYQEKNIGLVVNFSRRFVPEFEKIRDDIRSGLYGGYVTGMGLYGKGINHNGSHLIDLVRYFMGEIGEIRVTDCLHDFYDNDPSVSCVLTLPEDKKLHICHIDCRLFSVFELDMFFEKSRIRIRDSGFIIKNNNVGAFFLAWLSWCSLPNFRLNHDVLA